MLSPLQTSYKDYVVEQLAMAQNRETAEYWRNELVDYRKYAFPDPPVLSQDDPPNSTVTPLPQALYNSLLLSAQQQQVSVKSLCLAAFIGTLYMYSYEEDILIGLVENGRPVHEDGGRVLGCFLNTVPMRTKFLPSMTWAELAADVNRKQIELKQHGRMSLVQILNALGEQSHRDNPLFDIAFNFIDFHIYESVDKGLFEFMPYSFERTNTVLDFSVSVTLGELSVKMVSSYDQDFTSQLLQMYIRTLHCMTRQPSERISPYFWMTEEEKAKLQSFNHTDADYPREATVVSLFEQAVRKYPRNTALVKGEKELTYSELDRKVNGLASRLLGSGVAAGEHIGLLADRSFEMIIGIMAILKAGCAYVPLDPEFPQERLRGILADCGANWLLAGEGLSVEGYEGTSLDLSGLCQDLSEAQAISLPEVQRKPADLAYIMYTSGSTSAPKGVAVTHGNIVKTVFNNGFMDISDSDRMLQLSNYAFDGSTYEIFGALLHGAVLVLIAKKDVLNASELARTLEEQRITSAFMTAALFNTIVDWDVHCLRHVRRMFFGGEAGSKKHVLKALDCLGEGRLANGYGPTETTVFASTYVVNDQLRKYNSVPIGRPIHNTRVYILNQQGERQPIGVPGELYIAGEGLASGYYGQPDLTGERYLPCPFEPGNRMYRTGDLARWLPDGNLEYLGRIDQQVKIRGNRIELGEIEGKLRSMETISEALVIAAQDDRGHSYLCAYVVPAGEKGTVSAWKKGLRESLPEYMVPSTFVSLESFPLTTNGKLDRRALPKPERVQTQKGYTAPANPMEELLCQLWEEVLDTEGIGVEEHFFEIGGHSLKAMLLAAKLQKQTGVRISLQEMFLRPTIREMALWLMDTEPAQAAKGNIVPAPVMETYPVSSIQKRIYIVQQFENAGTSYNMPMVLELNGQLDKERLRNAFYALIERHESLRTSFELVDGELMQRVHEMNEVNAAPIFSEKSFRDNVEPEWTEERLSDHARMFIRPFDLGKAPLVRADLLGISPERHILLLDMHHIVSDGTSIEIWVRELVQLYQDVSLPSLRIQYKDFAYQEQQRDDEAYAKGEQYWLSRFSGELPLLELETDQPRPPIRSFAGQRLVKELEVELAEEIQAAAASRQSTVFMIMMAAYHVLLAKYSGQHDIVVGTPFACRGTVQDEPIVGMFANTLALRSQPLSELTVSEYFQQVRELALTAFEHGAYPLHELIGRLSLPYDASRHPLFDTMFVLQEEGQSVYRLPGLSISSREFDQGAAKFDLTWVCTTSSEGVKIGVEYRVDLWKEDSIHRMLAHYVHLLRQMVEDPHLRIGELELATETELQQLEAWNATEAEYPRHASVADLFEEQVIRRGSSSAVMMDGESLTYLQLNEAANRVAWYLIEKGVQPGETVGMLMERSLEMIVAILGIIKAGGAYVPLDPGFPAERMAYMLDDSDARWLIASSGHAVPGFQGEVVPYEESNWAHLSGSNPGGSSEAGGTAQAEAVASRPGPDHPLYIMYTSGSTGTPKGVVTTHRNVVKTSINNGFIEVTPTDRMLQLSNYAFDGSTYEIFGALLNGATLVLIRREDVLNPAELGRILEQERITSAFMTAALFNTVVDWDVSCLKHVRKLFFGGEAASQKHVLKALDYLGAGRIANGYGPTETTVFAATYTVDEGLHERDSVPIGRPIHNTKLYVLNPDGLRLPAGIPGELYIGGDGLAREYLGQPELTLERFVDNPYAPGERLYRTGDRVKWHTDGSLEFLERIDHQVKIRGHRIELGEIEGCLRQLSGVRETAVTAGRDEQGHSYLCAYVVPAMENPDVDSDEAKKLVAYWKRELKRQLPDYMVPTAFTLLQELPLTSNGKLDRKSLPEPQQIRGKMYAPATNHYEERLIGIWEEVLGVSDVGIHDHFFELGGHSLKAMLLVGRIHQALSVKLPLQDVFRHPELKEMAACISRSDRSSYQSIPLAPKQESYPVTEVLKQIYYTRESDPADVSYNMPMLFEIAGILDTDRLTAAIHQLLARHEALRTSFHMEGTGLLQKNHDIGEVDWKLTFLIAEDAADNAENGEGIAAALDQFMDQFVVPFDLAQAPLFRAGLLKLAANHHYLALDMHHIVSDGVSARVIYEELLQLYQGLPLRPVRLQFKDYSVWEQQRRDSAEYAEHEQFWLNQFEDYNGTAELPLDRPRPAMRNNQGQVYRFAIQPKLLQKLKGEASSRDTTLFMLLLSAYGILLSKYTGEEAAIVGTPTAGRGHADVEETVGMFVNTLAFRLKPEMELQVCEYLTRVKHELLQAYQHGAYSLSELVDKLNIPYESGRNPLFDTMFVLQDMDLETKELQNLTVTPLLWQNRQAKFDMTWAWQERGGQLSCEIEYRPDLWEESTIQRMARHYEWLLEQMMNDFEARIHHLELITPEEREQIAAWNSTYAEYPRFATVTSCIEEAAADRPDQTAVEMGEYYLTYRELNERADRMAAYLRSHGVEAGEFVGLMTQPQPDMIVAILAILKAGAAYVPLDPTFPEERLAYMLRASHARWLVAEEGSQHIEFGGTRIGLKEAYSQAETGVMPVSVSSAADQPLYLMFTSGSTGTPKGVVITHRNVVKTCMNNGYAEITAEDRMLQLSNYAFDGSTYEIFSALLNGATLVLVSREQRLDAAELAGTITGKRISAMLATTALFNTLVDYDVRCLQGVRKLIFGGEAASFKHAVKALEHAGEHRIINAYGPTETTVIAATYSLTDDVKKRGRIPIGKPIHNTRCYVVSDWGQLQPIGLPGELWIAGDGLAQGYLGQDELTSEKFIVCPELQEERLYRTGDLVRWLPDGNLEYVGRMDHQVKIRGNRVELGEVEGAILSLPSVKETVVTEFRDKQGHSMLVAYVVSDVPAEEQGSAHSVGASEWKQALKDRLPEYMIPSVFISLPDIPLTRNGKLDRKALPAPNIGDNHEYIPPGSETEAALAEVWQELLDIEQVGATDHFFELGGHSLKVMMLAAKVHERWGVKLAIPELFQNPVLCDMARLIDGSCMEVFEEIPSAPEQDTYPVSSAQERLYLVEQFEDAKTSYNMPMILQLTGLLDRDRLEYALQGLLLKHESLRTSFIMIEDELRQRIHPMEELDWQLEQGPNLSGGNLPEMGRNAFMEYAGNWIRPFDLSQAPLFRAVLCSITESEHYLLLDMHHMVSDGVSTGILYEDITALYQGMPLKPAAVHFKDYAYWQQEERQKPRYRESEQYWLNQFKTEPPVLDVLTGGTRPLQRSFEGDTYSFDLKPELSAKLRQLAASAEATLYMILFGAYSVMLSKYTGEEDIVVGAPYAGRNHASISSVAGMFVNTLAMRIAPQSDYKVRQWLGKVREELLNAYEHGDFPLHELMEKLRIPRDPGRNPLFDTMFVVQDAKRREIQLQELTIAPVEWSGGTAKFDMTWVVDEGEDALRLTIEYGTVLYSEAQIRQMAEHYEHILWQMADNPEAILREIELATEEEKQKILYEFNDTDAEYPKEATIQQLFERQAAIRPEHTAILTRHAAISYGELNRRADRLARYIGQAGIHPGEPIGLLADRSVEMIAGILGILKAGGAYVPLDPTYPAERLLFMLGDCQARLVLTDDQAALTGFDGTLISLSDSVMAEANGQSEMRSISSGTPMIHSGPDAESSAYIMYTSGSTGTPKGVVTTHRNIVKTSVNNGFIEITPQDRMLQLSNYAFDGSTYEIFGALLNGAALVLIPRDDVLNVSELAGTMRDMRITTAFMTCVLFNALVDYDMSSLRHIRRLFVGGEVVSKSHVLKALDYLGEHRVVSAYGPTETTVYATTYPVGEELRTRGSVPIGRPIHNTKVYVVDRHGHLAPIGVPGELYIAGDGLAKHYLGQPELTEERFLKDQFLTDGRMYRTGDLVRWLPDGNLEFLARIDQQVKIRGHRIECGEVEARLLQHPSVREVAVIPRQDTGKGTYLCAYIVPTTACRPEELRKHMQEALPDYMVPAYFVELAELPLTSNGKLNRSVLPEPDVSQVQETYMAPETEDERILAEVWSDMLGVEKVGINDNYFLLGGDSIKSIQIVSRLARYNRKLQVKHFMLYPTIAECAQYMEYIEDKRTCQDPVAGELPLTPIQRWFFEQSFTEPNHWNQSMMLYREQGWNPELVDKVFHRLVAHHDALRMRFVRESGSVRQINAGIEGSHFLLEVCKVGKDETEAEIERLANMLQAKMKLEEALVRLGLYQTEDGDHLLIAIHHLVVDGVSWRILLEDFMHLYDAMLNDEPASLPEKTDSYMEWSRKLVEPAILAKLAAEKDYWRDVEKQAAQLSYAGRRPCAIADSRTAGFQLDEAMTRKLLTEANRAYHTEVTDLLLTALALAYGERSDEGVAIHLEGHGREEFMEGMDLTRTVGWFTSIYPVVLPAPASELGETVPVIKELIRNIPNKGAGYSILKYAGAASQDNPIPSGFQPEAVFNYLGQFGTSASSGGFDPSPMPMGSLINELNSMTHLQEWNCVVSEGRFQLTFRYDPSAMGDSEAIQLLESYSRHLQALIEHCLAQDTEQFTPSDFSDDDLTFEELDEISDMLRKLE